MRPLLAACVYLFVLTAACSHAPQTTQTPPTHSRASFILEQSAVEPGSQATLGIQFVPDKEWHIYWQNPGDSGEPPHIQWRLPQGVTTGTLEWPAPGRLDTTAGTDYGYEGMTILLSTLQIPPTAQLGATLELGGDLRWLVCRDICVPQHAQLSVPIHIARATSIDGPAHLLLQTAAERIPKPLPARFHPAVASSPDSFRLTLFSSEPLTQARFFPQEAEQIDNGAPQELASRWGVMRLTLKKSDQLREDPQRLRGVIVLNESNSYQVDVPVHGSVVQKRRQ